MPLKDIVYLDGNYRSFKYFLTGQYDDKDEEEDLETPPNGAEMSPMLGKGGPRHESSEFKN